MKSRYRITKIWNGRFFVEKRILFFWININPFMFGFSSEKEAIDWAAQHAKGFVVKEIEL